MPISSRFKRRIKSMSKKWSPILQAIRYYKETHAVRSPRCSKQRILVRRNKQMLTNYTMACYKCGWRLDVSV